LAARARAVVTGRPGRSTSTGLSDGAEENRLGSRLESWTLKS
jgi:hypothetical protein